MECIESGNFRGETHQTKIFDGIIATETKYDYRFIDWHYHANPYFSLTTFGTCCDVNKRERLDCLPGSLLFHNCNEPHYNSKTDSVTQGYQIEFTLNWCQKFEINLETLPRSIIVNNPNVILPFYNIYKESKIADNTSELTIDSLLLQIIDLMRETEENSLSVKPKWVNKIDEILHDNFDSQFTLQELSNELDLHWAHLSRDFSKYFYCNFSEYIRKIRIEKSFDLLRNKKYSLTEVALLSGFADQSHFIRCFKSFYGITPKKFRQIISSR